MREVLKHLPALEISSSTVNRPRIHFYGDASGENLNCLDRSCCDVSRHDIWLGGILVLPEKVLPGCKPKAVGFSIKITTLPVWLLNCPEAIHIGFFEAIAVDLWRRLLRSWVDGSFLINHIDNAGDCYNFVSASSRCPLVQSVISSFIREDPHTDGVFWAWLGTARNYGDCPTRLYRMEILKTALDVSLVECSEDDIPWDTYKSEYSAISRMCCSRPAKRRKK